jgi:hypothetical protein
MQIFQSIHLIVFATKGSIDEVYFPELEQDSCGNNFRLSLVAIEPYNAVNRGS